MKLPEDVAYEVSTKLQDMIRINGIKKLQQLHIDIAQKIVDCNLLADTIKWMRIVSNG